MFNMVLKIFLLLSPIFYMPATGLAQRYQFFQFGYFDGSSSLLQLQFFQYGIVVLFLSAMFSEPIRQFKDKYAGFLFFMFVLGVLWHPLTIKNFYNIFLGFLLYYLVVVYSKDVKSILKVIVVVALLNTVWAGLQVFGIHLIYGKAEYGSIYGLMGLKSHLGIYQALAIPVCYALNPWLSIIPLVGLVLAKSFTAFIPMMIGMVYFLKDKLPKFMNMPILMAIVSGLFIFGGKIFHKLSLRFDVWTYSFKSIMDNIIYGHGIGTFNYNQVVSNRITIEYSNPYSIYFEVIYSLGVFGLIALVLFLYKKFKFNPVFIINKGVFVSCLIIVLCGLAYSFMDYPRLAGTMIVLFGLLTVIKGEYHGKNSVYGRPNLA